jgi:hypothetical protein
MTEPQRLSVVGASVTLFRDAPSWDGLRTATIGEIAFADAGAGQRLLEQAADTLRSEGFEGLIGPMDGDSWHKYRLVSESDGSPAFMLEPQSGRHDQAVFEGAGFEPISHYVSSRARLIDTIGPEPFQLPGITVTSWDGEGAERLITQLFELSGAAFAGNHFYKPITLESFLELYRPVLPLLDPRHVLFAHGPDHRLVGFLFGMPDRLATDGKPAAILKTYASGLRGVGRLLADSYHRRAFDLGFTEVIHALMHEDNVSRERSALHKAEVFRRYALMGRRFQQ